MENNEQNNLSEETKRPEEEGYFDFIKRSFKRIWRYRSLWFWGIFIPLGGGLGLNYNADRSPEETMTEAEARAFLDSVIQYWPYFVGAAVILFAILILAWIISAISRRGVIYYLNQLQLNENSAVKFKDVWAKGKEKFFQIIKLDLIFFAIGLALAIIALIGVFFAIVNHNMTAAIIIGFLAFFVMLPITFLLIFMKNISTVAVVLIDQPLLRAIEGGYLIVKNNLKESFKLFISLIVLRIIFASSIFITGIILVTVLGLLFTIIGSATGDVSELLLAVYSIVLTILMLPLMLFGKSFTALWKTDLWLWWIKKIGGLKIVETEEEEIEETEKIMKPEVAMEEGLD